MDNRLPSISLIVQNGPNPGRVFVVQGPIQTIGRDRDNDIAIEDSSLSRRHARIRALPEGFVLEDLGSTNGTFVNGQRITGLTLLRPGDVLQLGTVVTLRVQPGQLGQDYQQETIVPDSTFVPSFPSPATARPGPAHYPTPPAAARQQPTLASNPWLWIGCMVTVVLVAMIAGLVYYLTVSGVPRTQVAAAITQTPTAVQAQPTWEEPISTPIPTPTATPPPTSEPTEIAVPGVPALAAEEGNPPESGKQIDAGCNRQVEARADEAVVVNWSRVVAEDSKTDYLAQWLKVAYYDVRLDGVPITDLGLLKYYRGSACGDDGKCGPALTWWVNVGLLSVGAHHVTFDTHTTRAVSDGFDANPADGELDIYGPELVEARSCDIIVVESAAPAVTTTAAPPPPPPPPQQPQQPQQEPTPTEVPTLPTPTTTPQSGCAPEAGKGAVEIVNQVYGEILIDITDKANGQVVYEKVTVLGTDTASGGGHACFQLAPGSYTVGFNTPTQSGSKSVDITAGQSLTLIIEKGMLGG